MNAGSLKNHYSNDVVLVMLRLIRSFGCCNKYSHQKPIKETAEAVETHVKKEEVYHSAQA